MRRGVFILVDPYVLENIRSADGEIIEHFNNKQWFKVMNKLDTNTKVLQLAIQL